MKEKRTARDSAPSKGLVLGLALAVIGAMVGAAEILKIEDIIFPEAAALTIGFWIAPVCPWRVEPQKGVAMMVIAGVLGYGISALLPAPLLVKIVAGYGCGAAQPEQEGALPVQVQLIRFVLLLAFVLILAVLGVRLGHMMFIAPPLIVGAAGIVDNPKPSPILLLVKILILCAAAAVLGAGCRLVLTETMGIAAWISAAAAFALVLLLAWRWGLWFPPAGAVTLLAYLVPAKGLSTYFLWIALGAAALGASAVAVRLITKKQTDKPLRY